MGKSHIGTTAKNSNCVRQHRKMTPGEWICCVTSLSMGKKRRWRRVSRRHVVGTSVRLTKYHTTIEAENKSPEIERRCASALWSLRPPTRFTTPRKSRKKAESIDRVRQIKKKTGWTKRKKVNTKRRWSGGLATVEGDLLAECIEWRRSYMRIQNTISRSIIANARIMWQIL